MQNMLGIVDFEKMGGDVFEGYVGNIRGQETVCFVFEVVTSGGWKDQGEGKNKADHH